MPDPGPLQPTTVTLPLPLIAAINKIREGSSMNFSQCTRGLLDMAVDVHNGRPVIPDAMIVGKFSKTQELLTEACGHLIEIRGLLPAAAPAAPPQVACSSGAAWASSDEQADLALAAGSLVIAGHDGVVAVGVTPAGEAGMLSICLDSHRLMLTGGDKSAAVEIELSDVFALAELLERGLSLARAKFDRSSGGHPKAVGGQLDFVSLKLTLCSAGPEGPSLQLAGVKLNITTTTLLQLACETRALSIRATRNGLQARSALDLAWALDAAPGPAVEAI